MFYSIDRLSASEQEAFESCYAAVLAAEESGSVDGATLDEVDAQLAIAAVCDSGYAMTFIEEAWAMLS